MNRLNFLLTISRLKLIAIGVVFLILLVLVAGIVTVHTRPQLYEAIKARFLKQESSTLSLENRDNQIIISSLQIEKNDEQPASLFFNKLGITKEDLPGLSLQFDDQTTQHISQFLPLKVSLSFSSDGSKVHLDTPVLLDIPASIADKNYDFATGSAKLHYQTNNKDVYLLDITSPSQVVTAATSSGQLYLANRLQPLLPYLEKIHTIHMEVNGKDVKGDIVLE